MPRTPFLFPQAKRIAKTDPHSFWNTRADDVRPVMFGGWGCLGLDFFCSLYEGVVIKCQHWTTPSLLLLPGAKDWIFIIGRMRRMTFDDINAIVAPRLSGKCWIFAAITAGPRPYPYLLIVIWPDCKESRVHGCVAIFIIWTNDNLAASFCWENTTRCAKLSDSINSAAPHQLRRHLVDIYTKDEANNNAIQHGYNNNGAPSPDWYPLLMHCIAQHSTAQHTPYGVIVGFCGVG